MLFSDFSLNPQLLRACEDLGYITPTPIQEKVIPLALAGHDIMGIAQTGTGKTAAYLLPILMKIKYAQGEHARALIIAPTRELVIQIEQVAKELAKHTDLRCVALYGGTGTKTQKEALAGGVDIIVATLGRFMELYFEQFVVVKHLKTLVIDEADKMMDMGFMPKINKLLEVIPLKRQNLLFSATIPEKVVTLSEDFLEYPTVIEITPSATTAETITQELYKVPNIITKINIIKHFFQKFPDEFSKVMIFARTRRMADEIVEMLVKSVKKNKIAVLHANKDQNARLNAMEKFREGELQVLVATDVASRGIDISEVSHVINFDVPIVYEDYVHRIGRTGRANKEGVGITFCTMSEEYHIEKIQKIIKQTIPVVDIPMEVEIYDTPFEERQNMLKEIDNQKRKEDPDFQGAFHQKKSALNRKPLTKEQRKKMLDEKSRKTQIEKDLAKGIIRKVKDKNKKDDKGVKMSKAAIKKSQRNIKPKEKFLKRKKS